MGYGVQHFLVNGSTGDPALYIGLGGGRGSLLFDCGDLRALSTPRIHRVRDLFVSHAHIDHFFGFDWFLRCALGKDHAFELFGPPGMAGHVRGKLAGYLWNIAMDFRLTVTVWEVSGGKRNGWRFVCEEGVEERPIDPIGVEGGLLRRTPYHEVYAATLDHGTPSLAFSFRQKAGVRFDREGLERSGLELGSWMKDLEVAYLEEREGELSCGSRRVPLQELYRFVELKWGKRITYIADTRFSPEVFETAVALAEGSDVLYCAAKFADADRKKALETHHLTAGEAGRIARAAGVAELVLFHPSKKYHGNPEPLLADAAAVFDGPVRVVDAPGGS